MRAAIVAVSAVREARLAAGLGGQLRLAECKQRLVVDLTACTYSEAVLKPANGLHRKGPDNSIDRTRGNAFFLQCLLDSPNLLLIEARLGAHVQLSHVRDG